MDISSREPSIFQFSQPRKVYTLNTNCNAAHLSEILFENVPSGKTFFKCFSQNCQSSHEKSYLTLSLNLDIILLNGQEHLQNAVNDLQQVEKNAVQFPKCKQSQQLRTTQYVPLVVLDTSLITQDSYIEALKKNLNDM